MVKQIAPEKIINVIEREETETPEPSFKIVQEDKKFCPHSHLNIFKHHRLIYCTDCGAKLEAFDAILSMAGKDNQCIHEMKWRKVELRRLNEEKGKLENEIKNLKAQKRRLTKL